MKRYRAKRKHLLWKHLYDYRFNSLLIRNFFMIILLVIFPIVFFVFLYGINMQKIIKDEISASNQNALYRSADVIDAVMQEVKVLAYNFSASDDVQKFKYSDYDSIISEQLANNIFSDIAFFTSTYDYIESIYIYSAENNLVISGGQVLSLEATADKLWLPYYQELKGSMVVQFRRKNDYYPYYISFICPINSNYMKLNGAVIINLNIEKLGKLIGRNENSTQQLLWVDNDLRLYFNSDYEIMANLDYAPDYMSFLQKKSGSFSEVMKLNGEEFVVSCVTAEGLPWRYVLLSPMSYYQERITGFNRSMEWIILFGISVSLIMAYILTIHSFKPVQNIINAVESAAFSDDTYLENGRRDEIQYITGLVRNTQRKNSQLQVELQERMKKLNDAQMRALQSQIDPHFLYNTLDTINWMSIERLNGKNEISQMVTCLAELLQIGLQRSNYLVTVEEEIYHTKLYLNILEYRYKGRLTVKWDIDNQILHCKIVKLSIQPIVENAIKHGLREKRYKGHIYINGGIIGDNVVISVEDDGVGMDQEAAALLNKQLQMEYESDDRHIGMRNVNQRFKLIFGDKCGIAVMPSGNAGGGLAVSLIFPINYVSENQQKNQLENGQDESEHA